MKQSYLPKSRTKSGYLQPILILLGIFILGSIIFAFLGSSIIKIISPVWRSENVVSKTLGDWVSFFNTQGSLVKENAALKDKVFLLEAEVINHSNETIQKDELLRLLGRTEEVGGIIAPVLVRPPKTPYDILVIDIGKGNVSIGQEVRSIEGYSIGKIFEVSDRVARVKLFSSNGEELAAILEREEASIILEGQGGGSFRFELPRELNVEIGDRVLSSNISSYPLGVVEDIEVHPTDSFKEVFVSSPINIFEVRFIEIIQ